MSGKLNSTRSGFYVFPVAVVEQTFKGNGLTVASDVHQVPVDKLHSIFGADSAPLQFLTASNGPIGGQT